MDTEEFRGDEFDPADFRDDKVINTDAVIAEMNKPRYYTVGDLQAMVAQQTGKPCASRNRPALLKRLGLSDVPRPADLPKTGKAASTETLKRAVKDIAKASGVSVRLDGERLGKPTPRQRAKTAARAGVAASKAKRAADKPNHHAIALAYVKRAMARKNPPSLFNLMCEMNERRIKTPTGDEWRWKSSVQSLMRQAKAGK